MCDPAEDLNYDFNYNMFLIRTQMSKLEPQDRTRIISWMRKLAAFHNTINEMRLRNDYMYYLVVNVQKGELKAPFNDNPPNGNLPPLEDIMAETDVEGWKEALKKFREEYPPTPSRLTDEGGFLAARPKARCGAFCYMSVLCNTKENKY
ncbi:uncharacterized protein [Periplaneta americana]|uniref:uncharacterized protein n=1 Tax=Periplaneta americana TaxID=6978 RepID=UPI0037E9353B